MRMPCYSNKDKDKVLQICQMYQFRSLSLVRLLSMRMPRSSNKYKYKDKAKDKSVKCTNTEVYHWSGFSR